MKKIQKILAVLLAVAMILSLAACGAKKEDAVEKIGGLHVGMNGLGSKHDEHYQKASGYADFELIECNNLASALLDLESGKLSSLVLNNCVANYVAARNEKVAVSANAKEEHFAMMTLDANAEVYDILNNTIMDMKADGTLNALVENELEAYINSDPESKDLPHFDGAKTIKIGITGDMPPMDYVATNGKAAGFNIALLTEIANRAQVNFELVQIETGARAMALSSGKVDAVFWTKSVTCLECNGQQMEKFDGTLVTESYFSDSMAVLSLKSDK